MSVVREAALRLRVIVCAGPGGVGKTTCAAAIALGAARAGRRACVVTVDPARRLGDALGLDSLGSDPRRVDLSEIDAEIDAKVDAGEAGEVVAARGELWAAMLDAKSTFDEIVRRTALTDAQAETILSNRIYRNVSGALGSSQEYMATEKLYALHSDDRFDLLVVDTPPTRHAVDFLDAPGRLLRFLDNRVFRTLMSPTQVGFRLIGGATQIVLRGLSKVVGGRVVADTVEFFTAFEGMDEGFRSRAAAAERLLGDDGTAFVVVTVARRDPIDEAILFAEGLSRPDGAASANGPKVVGRRVAAVVANRTYPDFGAPPPDLAGPLFANMADLHRMVGAEENHLSRLADRLPGIPVVRVPGLPGDVHDLAGLAAIADRLFAGAAGASGGSTEPRRPDR